MPSHTFLSISNTFANGLANGSKRFNCRYYLEASFNLNLNRTAIIIMLNPSSTAKAHVFFGVQFNRLEDVDETTYRVMSELINPNSSASRAVGGNFDKIITLNIYPYYSSNPKDINVIFNAGQTPSCYNINFKIINRTIRNNPHAIIFLAWGKNTPINRNDIKRIKAILQRNKVVHVWSKQNQKTGFQQIPVASINKNCAMHGFFW